MVNQVRGACFLGDRNQERRAHSGGRGGGWREITPLEGLLLMLLLFRVGYVYVILEANIARQCFSPTRGIFVFSVLVRFQSLVSAVSTVSAVMARREGPALVLGLRFH